MKKFLLSLCVLAVASVCVFMTSCKDEDDTDYANVEALAAIEAQNPNYSYSYELTVGGTTTTYYNTSDLEKALNALPAGTTATVQAIATPKNGGSQVKGTQKKFTVQAGGTSIVIDVPTETGSTEAPITISKRHSGGAGA